MRQDCAVCGCSTYIAAKPAACGLLVDTTGRVLLGRRARDPGAGLLDVLGGFMEPGETPEQAVLRELHEETGLECTIGRYLGGFADVYGDGGDHTLNLAFECRFARGTPQPADDVAELIWFAPDELPAPGQFAFPSCVAILDAWLAANR